MGVAYVMVVCVQVCVSWASHTSGIVRSNGMKIDMNLYHVLWIKEFRVHSTKERLLGDYGYEVITVTTANTYSYPKGTVLVTDALYVCIYAILV